MGGQFAPEVIDEVAPNHFLHGQMGGQFAPKVIDEVGINPKKQWR